MSARTARWIAWFLVAIYFTLAGTGLFFGVLANTTIGNFPVILFIIVMFVIGIWPVLGARIVNHHPRHPVGWLLLASFPLAAIDIFTIGYASYATLHSPGSLPIPGVMLIWLDWSAQPFVLVAFTLLNLLFPSGRLLSLRWRIVAWMCAGALPIYLTLQFLEPGPVALLPNLINPYAVSESVWAVLTPFYFLTVTLFLLCSLASVVSLFRRLRRSRGDERQQLKWLVFPAILYWLSQPFGFLAEYEPNGIFLTVGVISVLISVPMMVIAISIAIFKYRLYDIDLIINRTLVYGALTASVVGLYVLVVGGAGLLIQTNIPLAGLLITGVVFGAIFRPMRAIFQKGVDRLIPGAPPAPPEEHRSAQDISPTLQAVDDAQPAARWMRLARAGWYVWAAIAWGILILSATAQIITLAAETTENFNAQSPSWSIAGLVAQTAGALISLVLAGVLYLKRPNERPVLLTSYFLLVNGAVMVPLAFLEPVWSGAQGFAYSVIQPIFFAPLLIAFLSVFPNGRFVPAWTRWLLAGAILYGPAGAFLLTADAFANPTPIFIAGVAIWFVLIFIGLYAQLDRYHRVSNAIERQQTKWVIFGFSVAAFVALLITAWSTAFNVLSPDRSLPRWAPIANAGWFLVYAAPPVSLTFAVMRYRLFDIDLIINRTLVYGTLTASVVGAYVLIVGGAGLVFQANVTLAAVLITVVTTGMIYRPLRAYIQGGVDRLMYGRIGVSPDRPLPHPPENERPDQEALPAPAARAPVKSSVDWLRIARLAWYPAAALAFGILLAAIPGYFVIGSGGVVDRRFAANAAPWITILLWITIAVAILASLIPLFLAVLLFRRRSDDRMALLTSFLLLAYGVTMSGPFEALEPFLPGIATYTTSILIPLFQPFILLLLAVFPDGRFVPRWIRWPTVITFLMTPLSLFWTTQLMQSSLDFSQPVVMVLVVANVVLALAIWVSIIYGQAYRYRHVSTPQQKQQTKWVLYGLGVWLALQILSAIPWTYANSLPPGTPYPAWLAVASPVWLISIVAIPLTLTIAVMRYRLFEIDFIINRTLVYGALTVTVAAIYIVLVMLIVGGVGLLFQTQSNLIIGLLATALVAVLFQPLRERVQRAVNRLLYGERDNPFALMTSLSRRLEAARDPEAMLSEMVRTVAQALKLPFVAIAGGAPQRSMLASWGTPAGEAEEFPLIYQAETVGQLMVAPRTPGERFDGAEQRLFQTIAGQAGALVQAVRLTNDLRQSRMRIVSAREEERRRLRRDLHDGLGASLAALHLQTGVLKRLIGHDAGAAAEVIAEFREELGAAIDEIRRVVYALRPPALDELGLVSAIRAQAARWAHPLDGRTASQTRQPALSVAVDAPGELPPLPAAVEVAAYRIVQEALTNVMHHADARQCVVHLHLDGGLQIEIVDDGVGIADHHRSGMGLVSMRERAAELGGTCLVGRAPGGGTRVTAWLPLPQE